jgi:hypothetical protein
LIRVVALRTAAIAGAAGALAWEAFARPDPRRNPVFDIVSVLLSDFASPGRPDLIAFDFGRDWAPASVRARAIAKTLHHYPASRRIQFRITA